MHTWSCAGESGVYALRRSPQTRVTIARCEKDRFDCVQRTLQARVSTLMECGAAPDADEATALREMRMEMRECWSCSRPECETEKSADFVNDYWRQIPRMCPCLEVCHSSCHAPYLSICYPATHYATLHPHLVTHPATRPVILPPRWVSCMRSHR